jgi:cobalt/nickel transport system ATP-binding protein
LIDALLDAPVTVVAATHNLSLAAELGSRCLVMGEQGRLLFDGAVEAALGDLALLGSRAARPPPPPSAWPPAA